jgi:hypothetical protein
MNNKITKINNKKFKSKKTKKNNKTLKIVNKCLEKKSNLQPLPLSYFKNLAIKIFNLLEENNSQTKKKCIDILQNFPFCEKNNIKLNTFKFKSYLQRIFQNNLFTKNEKKRRITSALIDMAWEYITTMNADIGTLSNDGNPHHLYRPIKEEYQYYKNVHNLEENKYNYM